MQSEIHTFLITSKNCSLCTVYMPVRSNFLVFSTREISCNRICALYICIFIRVFPKNRPAGSCPRSRLRVSPVDAAFPPSSAGRIRLRGKASPTSENPKVCAVGAVFPGLPGYRPRFRRGFRSTQGKPSVSRLAGDRRPPPPFCGREAYERLAAGAPQLRFTPSSPTGRKA